MRFGLRELVFVLVLVGMPLAAYWFVFMPTTAKVEQVKNENQQKQAKLDQLKLAKHIDDLGNEIDKLTNAINLFEAKLPEAKEVEVILKQVWQLATKSNLKSRSVRTEKLVQVAGCTELPIKMELIGDFDGFYKFLLELEKLSRITRIHAMDLSKVNNQEGFMVAKFTLSIFFEKQTTKKPKGA